MTDLSSFLIGGTVGVGLIGAFWDKIKLFFRKVFSLFIARVIIEEDLSEAVRIYFLQKFKKSRFATATYDGCTEYIRPIGKHQKIGYEILGKDTTLFWKRWIPILVSSSDEKDDSNSNGGGKKILKTKSLELTYFRFTVNPDKIIAEALELYNKTHDRNLNGRRFFITNVCGYSDGGGDWFTKNTRDRKISYSSPYLDKRVLKWSKDDLLYDYQSRNNKSLLEVLAFPKNVEDTIDEIKKWSKSEEWYHQHNLAWKKGWLLHGPPGTGKSSLVRAIGEELDLPIYVFDISTLSNSSLRDGWRDMKNSTPCIALIEDIDSIYDKRKNIQKTDIDKGVTFDCLLNCIDGIELSDGIITIITTNNIDKVDDALGGSVKDGGISTRPGRIDRVIELGILTEREKRKIAARILCDCSEEMIESVITNEKETGAQFTERCARLALGKYWNEKIEVYNPNPRILINED